jgi:hypothetical protein
VRGLPKVNVFCAISKKVYGPIFFAEPTHWDDLLGHVGKLADALVEVSNDYFFQQDSFPADYHKDVREYLNQILPQR